MLRYVGFLTFALNYKIHGSLVVGYHIVNIAIHIANAILVYVLVLLTFRTPFLTDYSIKHNYRYIPFFSALLFAVHPLQSELVTGVFQRFVSLAAFFYLFSLTAYIQARLSDGRMQRFFYYIASFISAVLAMKTKEIAFTLPLMLTLYEVLFFRDTWKRRLLFLAPMLLTLSIIPLTLMCLMGTEGGGTHPLPGAVAGYYVLSRRDYMLTEFRVIVTYLRLLFMPVNLSLDYEYPVFKSFLDPQVMLSFLFLSALFGLGVYLIIKAKRSKHSSSILRLIGFGILWFFIALSVESSIMPLDEVINEYRVYLPSVGLIISIVSSTFLLRETVHAPKVRQVILVILVIVTGVLSVATYQRNEGYTDKIKIWEETAKRYPHRASVHYNLGNAYAALNMPQKAIEQYLITIKLMPDHAKAHNNLANIYTSFYEFDKAVEQYLIAIKLKPDLAEAHFNLGHVYARAGQIENAKKEITAGLKIAPDNHQGQQLLNEISGLH